MQELDELSFQFIDEMSSDSSALIRLAKVAEKKINILKDEHEKQNLVINVSKKLLDVLQSVIFLYLILFLKKLVEDEEQKKIDKDSTNWELLLKNTIAKISSTAVERLSSIKDRKIEIKKLFEIHEQEINNSLVDNLKKTIVSSKHF